MRQATYRGQSFGPDEVHQALRRFDQDLRLSFPESRWKSYAIQHDGKSYPPKEILRLIIGSRKVIGGGKPINSLFERLGFTVGLLDEEEVTEEKAEESPNTETTFSLEYDLENSLLGNLEQLEPGLRLYTERGLNGQQVDAQKAGRIDILAVDADGDLVVIELKAEEVDRQICGQIQAYMGWVQENLADGKRVRGIIIASDFTPRAVYAAKVVPTLTLKRYQINFKFSDI